MYHAELRINGKLYLGIGQTRSAARRNAAQLVGDNFGGGLACMTRKYQRVESAKKH